MAGGRGMARWLLLVAALALFAWALYWYIDRTSDAGPSLEFNEILLPALSIALVVVSLALAGGSVKNLQVYGFTLPSLQGISGEGKVELDKRKATLETLSLQSEQLTASLDGTVDLSPRFTSSRLQLKGKVKLAGQLESQYQPMLEGFLRNKDPDGSYAFSLVGTLGKPRFSF